MRLWVLLAFIFRRQLKLDAARRYALLVRPAVENVRSDNRGLSDRLAELQEELLLRFSQLRHDLIQIEAGCLLSLRVVPESRQELTHVVLRGHEQEDVVEEPVVVSVGRDVRPLIRVGAEIEDLGHPQVGKRIGPDEHLPIGTLFHEHDFPVVVPQCDHLLIVVYVEE